LGDIVIRKKEKKKKKILTDTFLSAVRNLCALTESHRPGVAIWEPQNTQDNPSYIKIKK